MCIFLVILVALCGCTLNYTDIDTRRDAETSVDVSDVLDSNGKPQDSDTLDAPLFADRTFVRKCIAGTTRCGGAERCVLGLWQPVGLEACGNGLRSARMASVGSFQIDLTEVTRVQYDAWLATSPSTTSQGAECAWNASFSVLCEGTETSGSQPVNCVDWCDAKAYCLAVGKRLCGKIGGGPSLFSQYNWQTDQWMYACNSNTTANVFPYGGYYVTGNCKGEDPGGNPVTVGSMSACTQANGVFDLSGNVWEWTDACDATEGCRIRGGAFNNTELALRCDYPGSASPQQHWEVLGFRCCKD